MPVGAVDGTYIQLGGNNLCGGILRQRPFRMTDLPEMLLRLSICILHLHFPAIPIHTYQQLNNPKIAIPLNCVMIIPKNNGNRFIY
jgi:hypothetical protein